MDTKTVHRQPQVLLRGLGLSGGVYKNLIPLLFLSLLLSCFLTQTPLLSVTRLLRSRCFPVVQSNLPYNVHQRDRAVCSYYGVRIIDRV